MLLSFSLLFCLLEVPHVAPLPKELALPEGTVGYALKMETPPVTGFVQPGDKVDVLHTEVLADGKTAVKILLKKQLIVACTEVPTKKGDIPTMLAVTLAIKKEDVAAMVVAGKKGELKVVWRAPDAKDE